MASVGPGIRMPAIGMPVAMLFLEPQKTMAISSARLKPSFRLVQVVATRTISRMTQDASTVSARSDQPMLDQTPRSCPR